MISDLSELVEGVIQSAVKLNCDQWVGLISTSICFSIDIMGSFIKIKYFDRLLTIPIEGVHEVALFSVDIDRKGMGFSPW